MDVKDLKLDIINRVLLTDDAALLQTIFKILELNIPESALSEVSESTSNKSKNELENLNIQTLQEDINAIFEIKIEP